MDKEYAAIVREHAFSPVADIYLFNSYGEASVVADRLISSAEAQHRSREVVSFALRNAVAGIRTQMAGPDDYGIPTWACLYPIYDADPGLVRALLRMLASVWNVSAEVVWCYPRDIATGKLITVPTVHTVPSEDRVLVSNDPSLDVLFARAKALLPYALIRPVAHYVVSRELHRDLVHAMLKKLVVSEISWRDNERTIATFLSESVFLSLGASSIYSAIFDYFPQT